MARFRVTYRDDTPPSEVSVGAFAQIAAKRRYGVTAITGRTDKDGNTVEAADPEAALFAIFVEVVGAQAAADPAAFDKWLEHVEDFDGIAANGDGAADPTPAEASSASLPDSPPTSESTPSES